MEENQGRNSRQELGAGAGAMEEGCLFALLSDFSSLAQIHLSKDGTTYVGQTPLHQLAIKKDCLTDTSIDGAHSSLFPGDSRLVSLDCYDFTRSWPQTCVSPLVSGLTEIDRTLLFLFT